MAQDAPQLIDEAALSEARERAFSMPLEAIDVTHYDLHQQDLVYPFFERLRRDDPVHWHADSHQGPYWSVTRFEDIKWVDTHHDLFSSEPSIVLDDPRDDLPVEQFIAMDPPRHDVQRKTVAPVVGPRNLAALEATIRGHAAEILDGLPAGVAFNWVEQVSIELTTRMLATIFGFPFEDRHKLPFWSDVAAGGKHAGVVDSREEQLAILMDCLRTFEALRDARAAEPEVGMDLLSMLAHGEHTRDMPRMEFLGNLLLLIVGGNDTTRNSISGGVLALNRFPHEYEKLRADPGLIPNMVAEIIRWQTPLAYMRRTALEDVELAGKRIRAGDKLAMWYVSGNRDETVFAEPDRLRIDRPDARGHVAFGYGIHRCMGNRLAEMQLRVLWEEIQKRFRFVEVVGTPLRTRSNFVRGYTRLPVRVHPH
ncbi:MAG TPA: cytochrome P450 [Pseudomonadales bacterium]|nr:cytochrome P450 [Pseudomonadales bacterium]